MNTELITLETNDTMDLTSLPPSHKTITSKWVYKIKFHSDRFVEKAKARLVIRGFNQKICIDYTHTISHVATIATIRVLPYLGYSKVVPR